MPTQFILYCPSLIVLESIFWHIYSLRVYFDLYFFVLVITVNTVLSHRRYPIHALWICSVIKISILKTRWNSSSISMSRQIIWVIISFLSSAISFDMVQQRARVLYKTQNGAKFLTQIKEILFQGEPFCLQVLLLSINPELPPAISKALETLLSQTNLISRSNFPAHCADSPSQTFSEVTEILYLSILSSLSTQLECTRLSF